MRSAFTFFLSLSFTLCAYGQSCGFLGHRFKADFSYKPVLSWGAFNELLEEPFYFESYNFDEYYDYTLPLKDRVGVISGSENNLSGGNIFKSLDLSLSYVLNRKETIGLSIGRGRLYSTAFANIREILVEYSVPNTYNTYLLTYESYSGLAPLKRFFKLGIGFDVLKVVTQELEVEPFRVTYLNDEGFITSETFDKEHLADLFSDFKRIYPVFTMGFGCNSFITDNFYLKMGLDLNLSTSILAERNNSFDENNTLAKYFPNYRYFGTRLLNVSIGVGLNI